MKKTLFLILLGSLLLAGCKKDQLEIDKEKIEDYIAAKGLNAQVTDDDIYYVIDTPGTGLRPDLSNMVVVDYEGFLLDDTKFDSSLDRGQPATFPLSRVIRGWQLGIPLFQEGGSGTLIIPSQWAYGENPPPNSEIGRNDVLVFWIHLIEVQ